MWHRVNEVKVIWKVDETTWEIQQIQNEEEIGEDKQKNTKTHYKRKKKERAEA